MPERCQSLALASPDVSSERCSKRGRSQGNMAASTFLPFDGPRCREEAGAGDVALLSAAPGDIARTRADGSGGAARFSRGDMLKAAARGSMAALLRCVVLSFA